MCVTVSYMDPAFLIDPDARNRTSFDIYSFGLICSEIILGKIVRYEQLATLDAPTNIKELLMGLLNPDPSHRWTFKDIFGSSYVQGRIVCMICKETFPHSDLISCSDWDSLNSNSHALCKECFDGLVSSLINEKEPSFLIPTQGAIRCPAVDPVCTRQYSHKHVLRHTPRLFDKFVEMQQKVKEMEIASKLEKELDLELKKKLQDLCAMDEIQREAHLVYMEITESLLNLCCPRCNQSFRGLYRMFRCDLFSLLLCVLRLVL
jgi:serine/threonine protein kinase